MQIQLSIIFICIDHVTPDQYDLTRVETYALHTPDP